MQPQKPLSNGVLVSGIAFFYLIGLGSVIGGFASIGEDPDAMWVVLIGIVTLVVTTCTTPFYLRAIEKQRKAYAKHLKNNEVKKIPPASYGPDWSLSYWIGVFVVGALSFFSIWIYALIQWGLLFGLIFGWIPAVIGGFILGFAWPLVLLLILTLAYLVFKS